MSFQVLHEMEEWEEQMDKVLFIAAITGVGFKKTYFDSDLGRNVSKIPVKRGRAFTERDTQQSPGVAIINETMARRFWEKGDPLSDRLIIGRGVMREFADEPERQIIGVVGDVRNGGLDNDPGPMMYIPQAQVPDAANALNVEPDAHLLGRAHAGRTEVGQRGRAGTAAPGERPARVERADHERSRVDDRRRGSSSTCG